MCNFAKSNNLVFSKAIFLQKLVLSGELDPVSLICLHKEYACIRLEKLIDFNFGICDSFYENLPKHAKTTIEIWLKVGNNFIFN